jgi:hypothetical protein
LLVWPLEITCSVTFLQSEDCLLYIVIAHGPVILWHFCLLSKVCREYDFFLILLHSERWYYFKGFCNDFLCFLVVKRCILENLKKYFKLYQSSVISRDRHVYCCSYVIFSWNISIFTIKIEGNFHLLLVKPHDFSKQGVWSFVHMLFEI